MHAAQELRLPHGLLEHIVGAAVGADGEKEPRKKGAVSLLKVLHQLDAVVHGHLALLGVPYHLRGTVGLGVRAPFLVKVAQPSPGTHPLRRFCQGVGLYGLLPAFGGAGSNRGVGGAAALEEGSHAELGAGPEIFIGEDVRCVGIHHKGPGFGVGPIIPSIHPKHLKVQVGDGVEVDESGRYQLTGSVYDSLCGGTGGVVGKPHEGDTVPLRNHYSSLQNLVAILAPGHHPTALYGNLGHYLILLHF